MLPPGYSQEIPSDAAGRTQGTDFKPRMSESPPKPAWPMTFEEVKKTPPEGYSIVPVIQEPVALIRNDHSPFTAELAASIKKRGETYHIPVPVAGANYVLDGRSIKPLPKDAPAAFSETLKSKKPSNLSLAEVIALVKSTNTPLPVVLKNPTFETAKETAHGLPLAGLIPGLNATLYPYQDQGIAWMHRILPTTAGFILADQMGLGKTLQIIGLLLLNPPTPENPALIICPTTLIANWERELEKFAPSITRMIHRGAGRAAIHNHLKVTQVVITTYDTVVNDLALIRSIPWKFVITDEAQAFKNPSSQRRNALVQIRRENTIAITGTPVENTLKDLWSLSDFVIPGILGSESEFDLRFTDSQRSALELSNLTAPFILRRKVSDVAADLPPRIHADLPVELTNPMVDQYESIKAETFAKYPRAGGLVATGQLQLFCAHPWLRIDTDTDTEGWEDNARVDRGSFGPLITPKMEMTIDLLNEAFLNGQKVLVFSIFNQIGELIREAAAGLPTAYWGAINGSTEQSRRQEIIDEFSAHSGPAVLILNPKAAGAGLNITAATIVIHYTQVWNPALEAQASARAHRRGQTNPVTIYRLYYQDTVEKVMLDRTLWKQSLADDAVPITKEQNQEDLAKALKISPTHT
jgi:SNF2 family DNA or RNA helicase